jgi:hypothetical protein
VRSSRWLIVPLIAALARVAVAAPGAVPPGESAESVEASDDPRAHTPGEAAPAAPSTIVAPAEAPPASDPAPRVSSLRRAAAITAASTAGLLVRGAGSWIAGERRAAKRLALISAIGLAALAGGGLAIAGTGSNPYTIWPGVPLVVGGTGLLVSPWLADLWVAAGGARRASSAVAPPPWSLEIATTWQRDAYRKRALLGVAGHVELGRLGLDAGGHVDAQGASHTGELGARWRWLGPAPTGRAVDDGSRVVVRAALRRERDDDDRVTLATAEAAIAGRLDLARLDPAIAGAFAELSFGAGVTRTSYPRDHQDHDTILLAGFAWGVYLGDRGEAIVFYDHRRDGLAGGLSAWRAAGFIGSFGAGVDLRVSGPWAVRTQLQIGNAWLTTIGLRYLGGR